MKIFLAKDDGQPRYAQCIVCKAIGSKPLVIPTKGGFPEPDPAEGFMKDHKACIVPEYKGPVFEAIAIEHHCKCGIPSRYEHDCLTSDIPIPEGLQAKKSKPTNKKPSAWPIFIRNWNVGDSVVVSWTALISIQNHAKKLDQKVVWQDVPQNKDGMRGARVWRAK